MFADPGPGPALRMVFNTTELLEAILLRLPTQDLLLAMGVCRTLKNAIDTSITIQRALFMAPGDATSPDRDLRVLQLGPHLAQLPLFGHVSTCSRIGSTS